MKFRLHIVCGVEDFYTDWCADDSPLGLGGNSSPVRAVADFRRLYPTGVFQLERDSASTSPDPEEQAEIEARWLDGTRVFEQPTEPFDATAGDFWIIGG